MWTEVVRREGGLSGDVRDTCRLKNRNCCGFCNFTCEEESSNFHSPIIPYHTATLIAQYFASGSVIFKYLISCFLLINDHTAFYETARNCCEHVAAGQLHTSLRRKTCFVNTYLSKYRIRKYKADNRVNSRF